MNLHIQPSRQEALEAAQRLQLQRKKFSKNSTVAHPAPRANSMQREHAGSTH